jgi:hypothetical protein
MDVNIEGVDGEMLLGELATPGLASFTRGGRGDCGVYGSEQAH